MIPFLDTHVLLGWLEGAGRLPKSHQEAQDFEGKELWHRNFGRTTHMFPNASSPNQSGDVSVL